MAVEKRREWAEALSQQLGGCPIAFDPHPRFNIGNIWENNVRAWRLQDRSKEWSLVIQDDAILCENFLERAQEHLKRADELGAAVQFYVGNGEHFEEFKEHIEKGYYLRREMVWGVAIAVKTEWLDEMIRVGTSFRAWQDDIKIKHFLLKKNIPTYFPLPCLVDHRRMDENPSFASPSDGDRYSPLFKK